MRLLLLGLSSVCIGALFADDAEPVCQKCQRIREYNSSHPENNYYYYDDYLKDQQKKQATNTTDKTKKNNEVAETQKTQKK